ncbi:hypothetical protein [Pseudomonas sp. WC2]|uniref:hypothetical protein n=1 Tax=Pseudomonas sp. WC2 TaxID=3424773 RepID=UPI003D335B4A
MAENKDKRVTVVTYDKSYSLRPEQFQDALGPGVKRWDWIRQLKSKDAHEYYLLSIEPIAELLRDPTNFSGALSVSFPGYIDPFGDMGQFVLKTKHNHGDVVALYLMEIATFESTKDQNINFNRGEALKKTTSYEYQLAHYLFFQYINAADYITDDAVKTLNALTKDLKKQALSSLDEIDQLSNRANQLVADTGEEFNRTNAQMIARHRKRIRRYRKAFSTVREEAATTRKTVMDDLSNAHRALLSKLDIEASVTYWEGKAVQHEKSSWRWLTLVIITVLLTFSLPVVYYFYGGVSSLAANRHADIARNSVSSNTAQDQTIERSSQSSDKKAATSGPLPNDTIEKVAFASGIADLTGAALIVTLMSVLLRLCLRQYNTRTYLHHDAEERVTMIKTYLALASEGKLTSDGDMKLVLDTLFRASQSAAIPDQTPATPIELIVKAITEKK